MSYCIYLKKVTLVITLLLGFSVFAGGERNFYDPSQSINKEIDALVQAQLNTKKEAWELQKKHYDNIVKLYDESEKLYKRKLDEVVEEMKDLLIKIKTFKPLADTPTKPKFPWESREAGNLAVKTKNSYDKALRRFEELGELKNKYQTKYAKLSINYGEFKKKNPFFTNVEEWAKFKL